MQGLKSKSESLEYTVQLIASARAGHPFVPGALLKRMYVHIRSESSGDAAACRA